jgi:predicted HD phosphohydrolase
MNVDELLALLATGNTVYDEPDVDALSHALQCGALLLESHPRDVELAVAGLVHDISDIATPDDHSAHDQRGAALVAPLLGDRVAKLVGAHVVAKRFLVTTDPSYRAQLSARSIETLHAQGEMLTDEEVARLRNDPDINAIVALRRADERAKDVNAQPPGLETWAPLLEDVAR